MVKSNVGGGRPSNAFFFFFLALFHEKFCHNNHPVGETTLTVSSANGVKLAMKKLSLV